MIRRDFLPSYIGPRDDIVRLVPPSARRVLDLGCSVGVVGSQIKERNSAEIVGIELDEEMGAEARRRLDKVIIGDVETLQLDRHLESNSFDCIILADVLEHLKDPWRVLGRCVAFLTEGGVVVASIPNVRHYTTVISLLSGYWPYRERGIHDRTHLRFFTLRNIEEMFCGAGLKIVTLERGYRIVEAGHDWNQYSKYLAFWPLKEFLTFQYIVTGTQDENGRMVSG